MRDRSPRRPGRDLALVLVTAVGTLAILLGVATLLDRAGATQPRAGDSTSSPRATASVRPSESAGTGSPSPDPQSAAPPSTAAGPDGDPVLVGAGDIASCDGSGDEATAGLLDGIAGTVFTAGDNAYESGTPEEFANCYGPSWGRHKARTRPAPGNHDHQTDGLAGYLGYFGPSVGTAREPWYSFDLGAWHIVMLDSMCDAVPGGCGALSQQVAWLRQDLAAHDTRCTLAIWHHPRFTSGVHGSDPAVGPFWDALYAANADLVINGHDHDYERFAPQAPDGRADGERGIREFVIGTGGARLRDFPTVVANSELRASLSHGVLVLTLHAASYEWAFVPTEGSFEDRGSAHCH